MKYIIRSYLILLLIFLFSTLPIFSQDLIFTNEGDSIKCKITRIRGENIYFSFIQFDELRESFLPVDKIQYFKYGVFESETENYLPDPDDFYKFRAAANIGPAYRTARLPGSTPSYLEKYLKALNKGYSIGLESAWYFNKPIGVGVKFNNFNTKNAISLITVQLPDGSIKQGPMSQDISIFYVAPYFSSRVYGWNKENVFIVDLGFGLMSYREKHQIVSENFRIKGNTLTVSWSIGYDIGIAKNTDLGFLVSYYYGYLTKLEISDGTNTYTRELETISYEKLSRLDFSAGFRFKL